MTIVLSTIQIGLFILAAIGLIAYVHRVMLWSQLMEVGSVIIIVMVTLYLICKVIN
ncbi:hypothetical protein [Liquorilactobacillus aquaticus]|uniref:hypothetical protein n=1 Tax=Liquorilactobacillus aquaticus TaxID=392566 RepID=UPI000B27CE6E|nr:hypothetical protein [Liquorilactobacillus aquaticus]